MFSSSFSYVKKKILRCTQLTGLRARKKQPFMGWEDRHLVQHNEIEVDNKWLWPYHLWSIPHAWTRLSLTYSLVWPALNLSIFSFLIKLTILMIH